MREILSRLWQIFQALWTLGLFVLVVVQESRGDKLGAIFTMTLAIVSILMQKKDK